MPWMRCKEKEAVQLPVLRIVPVSHLSLRRDTHFR